MWVIQRLFPFALLCFTEILVRWTVCWEKYDMCVCICAHCSSPHTQVLHFVAKQPIHNKNEKDYFNTFWMFYVLEESYWLRNLSVWWWCVQNSWIQSGGIIDSNYVTKNLEQIGNTSNGIYSTIPEIQVHVEQPSKQFMLYLSEILCILFLWSSLLENNSIQMHDRNLIKYLAIRLWFDIKITINFNPFMVFKQCFINFQNWLIFLK